MFCSVNNSYNESDTFPPWITRICIKTKRKCHVDEYRANGEGSENVTIKINVFFSNLLAFTLTPLKWQMLFHCLWSWIPWAPHSNSLEKEKNSSWGVYALQRTSHKEISRHGRAAKKCTKKRAARPVKFVVLLIKASSTRKQRFFPSFSKEYASPRSVFKSIHPLTRKRSNNHGNAIISSLTGHALDDVWYHRIPKPLLSSVENLRFWCPKTPFNCWRKAISGYVFVFVAVVIAKVRRIYRCVLTVWNPNTFVVWMAANPHTIHVVNPEPFIYLWIRNNLL